MPKPYDPFDKPEDKQAFELCGFTHPFIGESLEQTYAHLYGPSTTYYGLDTGFHCLGPMSNFDVFTDLMGDPTYDCKLPEIKGWNNKYYNPVCRGWYAYQKKAYDKNAPRGIITDLYLFAGDPPGIGLTSCAPIQEFTA